MKRFTFFYLFEVLIQIESVNLMFASESVNSVSQLYKILEKITSLSLELRTINDADNDYVDMFLKKSEKPITISIYGTKYNKTETFCRLHDSERCAFAIVSDMESLPEIMRFYISSFGRFFFIITDNVDIKYLEYLLRTIWIREGSPHIYFLTKREIFTFHPFAYDFEESAYGKVMKFDNYRQVHTFFKNMNGYPFIIECFRSAYSIPVYNGTSMDILYFTGADSKVANLLQERMNFTFIQQYPDQKLFGYKLPNGTFNGAIGRILRRETDAVLTGFFIKDYGTHDMAYTAAVYSDRLCCYVPKAKRVPQSVLPLFSLDFKMWMSYIFTAFICGGIWCVIRCFNLWLENHRRFKIYISWHKEQFFQIFCDTWIIWVRVALRNFPHFCSERLFVLYICLLSVIFGAIFDSSLATVYIKPLYFKDINTLADLDKSNLKIYYKYISMKDDLFPNHTSALFDRLNSKMHYLESTKLPLIEIMSQKGGFAGVTRDSVLSLENVKYFTSNKIYKIPECPKTYSLAYVLPKHSVYSRWINTLLLEFLGAGLINKWIDEMHFTAELAEDHAEKVRISFKVLTLTDLQLPFYALMLGTMLAGIVLISEICRQMRMAKKEEVYFKYNFVH